MAQTKARGPERWLRGLLARAGNPLNWSPADKSLVAALLLVPFVAWYAVVYWLVLRHPDLAPYLDQEVLHRAFRWQVVFVGAWLAIVFSALFLRRWAPTSRLIVHAEIQLYSVTALLGSYVLGHYTSLYTGVAVVGGYTVAFVLFDRRATLPGLASFLVGLLGMTLAEQAGLIPYAPLLRGEPYAHGHLSGWWLAGPGAVAFVGLLAVVALFYYVVERWRQREDELARANDIISRYVASQLAEHIRLGNYGAIDRHERRR